MATTTFQDTGSGLVSLVVTRSENADTVVPPIEVERVVTPADWQASGLAMGAPFAAAHTFGQTGPFRPSNLAPGLANVVFTGSGTQPGVGVPMVLVSGKLAAERITGRN